MNADADFKIRVTIISETKGIYKQKDLVSILLGKNNALLASHNIVDNKYFGSGKSKNEQFWNGLLWYLRAEGMVLKKVENFGSLAITEKGLKYLKNPKELLIPINKNNSVTT